MVVSFATLVSLVGTSSGLAGLEVPALVAIAVLTAVLLAVRVFQALERRRRKSVPLVYVDHDAARYLQGSADSLVEQTAGAGPQPLAPSFTAPRRTGADPAGAQAATGAFAPVRSSDGVGVRPFTAPEAGSVAPVAPLVPPPPAGLPPLVPPPPDDRAPG